MPSRTLQGTQKRNVLVAVAGQTPAIITESLWALEQERRMRIDEIRVITTAQGRTTVIEQLLGENGRFAEYCADYRVPAGRIAFSEQSIYVLSGSTGELEDIRTSQDNTAAADQVFALIREWTQRRQDLLFCSLAGGRKTLGVYLAMALMLCGRSEDSLSHVLVSPEFETGVHDFYYPPPQDRCYQRLAGFDPERRAVYQRVSARDARVELADIPFPRLREIIGGELPLEKGLSKAVHYSQIVLAYLQHSPPVTLHLHNGLVTLGRLSFTLTRQLIAVYAFFLTQFNAPQAVGIDDLFAKRKVVADFERRIDRLRLGEQERYAWESMRDVEEFRARLGPCISKVNREVNKAFGRNRLAERYRIATGRKYGVNVPAFEIVATEGRPLGKASQ